MTWTPTPPEVQLKIDEATKRKAVRIDALRAFGFDEDVARPWSGKPVTVISSRNLHMDKITEKLRSDIPGFLKRYFNFPDEDFPEKQIYSSSYGHKIGYVPHIQNLLEEMFVGGKIVAEWATDHGKSFSACKFFPILSLAENPDESHILMGSNEKESKRRVQVVMRELQNNVELLRDYPWLKQPERPTRGGSGITWSAREFTVSGRSANRPDPSLYAGSITAGDMRQRRGKLIMDDIEGSRNSKYALSREELYNFIMTEATRNMEGAAESKRPLLIALGTPFDPASIYFRLEDENWRLIKVPAYAIPYHWTRDMGEASIEGSLYMKLPDGSQSNTDTPWWDRAMLLPDRYFTWPRKREKVTGQDPLFGKGLKKAAFGVQYLLDPGEAKPGRLSLQQLKALVNDTATPQEGDWQTFVSLDPAAGTQTRFADYAGISVVRIRWPRSEKYPQVRVLEAFRFEGGLFEQVQICADLCRDYQCKMLYESNAQQGGVYKNAFGHSRSEVKLIPWFTTHDAKFDEQMGLTVIATLVREEHLKVPAHKIEEEGMQAFLTEIRDLGTERHDHITASVWFVVRYLYEQVRAYNGPALVGTMGGRSFGRSQPLSWRTFRRG